ncbi:MAG: putative Ig domain-containing protein, partial [Planctomycetes bacterium]|nr:putative Ig domain-containing protein [Planctomycetota bacterium]
MLRHAAALCAAALSIASAPGCANDAPPVPEARSIRFVTESLPPGEAGLAYEATIFFSAAGGAPPPDRFEISEGSLPQGLSLARDAARITGTPREPGSHAFTVKAIATVEREADLAAARAFRIEIGEGAIAILTPTAEEGTSDPAVPAFPARIPFVNPANPEAFFSFAFLLGGGSGRNVATVYGPREWELSVFDAAASLRVDTEEPGVSGFLDGGVFALQAGPRKVQIGGFPSPRGPVLEDRDGDGIQESPFLVPLAERFQDAHAPRSSRRDLADTAGLAAGDPTLGSPEPLLFTDYFDPAYEPRAKYPFAADQYGNAFFVPYVPGKDPSPLQYRLIVEAIDTRGTPQRDDDVIARKAFVARVEIPDIAIDTVLLPAGRAGVLYAAQLSLSGGVPPLYADLAWADGTGDLAPTPGDPLGKDLLGIEIDPRTWTFLGAPRASGGVELTVRAWAQVMNPKQGEGGAAPTGIAGERDGVLDPDGAKGPAAAKGGRHRTFRVEMAEPAAASIANASLAAGVDGQAYPGDRIWGAGGAPLLVPYPPGFFEASPGAVYPSAAERTYEWEAVHVKDASYPKRVTAPGLPAALHLMGSPAVATNGTITGVALDRGFHVVRFEGR